MQVLPREGVLIPTFWKRCGEDGKKGLEWLKGTEGGRELKRKDNEGLSYVCIFALSAQGKADGCRIVRSGGLSQFDQSPSPIYNQLSRALSVDTFPLRLLNGLVKRFRH
jgi:hypothetical protein